MNINSQISGDSQSYSDCEPESQHFIKLDNRSLASYVYHQDEDNQSNDDQSLNSRVTSQIQTKLISKQSKKDSYLNDNNFDKNSRSISKTQNVKSSDISIKINQNEGENTLNISQDHLQILINELQQAKIERQEFAKKNKELLNTLNEVTLQNRNMMEYIQTGDSNNKTLAIKKNSNKDFVSPGYQNSQGVKISDIYSDIKPQSMPSNKQKENKQIKLKDSAFAQEQFMLEEESQNEYSYSQKSSKKSSKKTHESKEDLRALKYQTSDRKHIKSKQKFEVQSEQAKNQYGDYEDLIESQNHYKYQESQQTNTERSALQILRDKVERKSHIQQENIEKASQDHENDENDIRQRNKRKILKGIAQNRQKMQEEINLNEESESSKKQREYLNSQQIQQIKDNQIPIMETVAFSSKHRKYMDQVQNKVESKATKNFEELYGKSNAIKEIVNDYSRQTEKGKKQVLDQIGQLRKFAQDVKAFHEVGQKKVRNPMVEKYLEYTINLGFQNYEDTDLNMSKEAKLRRQQLLEEEQLVQAAEKKKAEALKFIETQQSAQIQLPDLSKLNSREI